MNTVFLCILCSNCTFDEYLSKGQALGFSKQSLIKGFNQYIGANNA